MSVVIIGRNEGERLLRCIRSVKAMEFPADAYDIIYVDSGSTDHSLRDAGDLGARTVSVAAGPTTAARGRNSGLALVEAEFVLFLDGDTLLHPHFLRQALAYLEAHPRVAGVCGDRRELAPEQSLYNRVLDLDWNGPVGQVAYFGGDALVRVAALREVGCYREDLVAGEEPELCFRLRRAGHDIVHLDLEMTLHDLALQRFGAYWRRCYRTGYAYAEVAQLTAGETFGSQSRRNLIQVAIYFCAPVVLLMALRFWALPLGLLGAGLIWARTLWRARRRKASLATLGWYAVHAHLCQFPIFFGQLSYFQNQRRALQGKLIEYK